GSVTNAALRLPSSVTNVLGSSPDSVRELGDEARFGTKAALDSAYANGTYTLSLKTHDDGAKTLVFSLTGDTYPAIPHISNWNDTQSVDRGKDFVLTWDAFPGGTTNDYVQVQIEDNSTNSQTIFDTPQYSETNYLNGTSTSVTIPG